MGIKRYNDRLYIFVPPAVYAKAVEYDLIVNNMYCGAHVIVQKPLEENES